MIKKEYIQPEVKEVNIILPTILAGSVESVSTEEITADTDIAGLDLEFEDEEY